MLSFSRQPECKKRKKVLIWEGGFVRFIVYNGTFITLPSLFTAEGATWHFTYATGANTLVCYLSAKNLSAKGEKNSDLGGGGISYVFSNFLFSF